MSSLFEGNLQLALDQYWAARDKDRQRSGATGYHATASQAGVCVRQVAYEMHRRAGVKEGNTTLPLNSQIAWLVGLELEKVVKEALLLEHPSARFEVVWHEGLLSGRADAVYTNDAGELVVVEVKTTSVSGYYPVVNGNAPLRGHLLQAAVSAMALNAAWVRVIYVCKNAPDHVQPTCDFLRRQPRNEALQAWLELEAAVQQLNNGEWPDRLVMGDEIRTPDRRLSSCKYCDHFDRCVAAGPGVIPFSPEEGHTDGRQAKQGNQGRQAVGPK